MDFKIGFDVRPKRANSIGEIIFEQSTTEGLVEVAATEEQCGSTHSRFVGWQITQRGRCDAH